MKIRIDDSRCEGHGRCYALLPTLIEPDEIGNGRVIGDGTVPADLAEDAHKAAANCPERAVSVEA